MSDEVKKPEAGEYWEHETSGDRVYFIGATPENEMVWQCHGDTIEAGNLDWSGWHHLPDCTGWDWQPETFPQYWTARDSDCDSEVAFVTAEKDKSWRLHYKHGGEYLFTINRFSPIGRMQLTKEQAEALLAPVESPNDWVTQGLVPPRDGIDEYLITGLHVFWQQKQKHERIDMKHGNAMGVGCGTLKVRCRRKDLPKIEPKTRTVTLTRWIVWDDGGVYAQVWWNVAPECWQHSHDTGETKTIEVPL